MQVPFALAPREAAQTSHPPLQAALQQYPSTQWPLVHSPHPDTLQSATRSHVPPAAFCCWQVELAAQ